MNNERLKKVNYVATYQGYLIRTYVWFVIFYSICLFDMFYLVNISDIKNWLVLLIIIPLFVLACSSETMTRNKKLKAKSVYPYPVVDFALKTAAFVISIVAYKRLMVDGLFYVLVSLFCFCVISSVVCKIIMWKKFKLFSVTNIEQINENVQSQI